MGDTIFKFDDKGDIFYIVLEGEVIVKTPAPFVIEPENKTPEMIFLYLMRFYKDI